MINSYVSAFTMDDALPAVPEASINAAKQWLMLMHRLPKQAYQRLQRPVQCLLSKY